MTTFNSYGEVSHNRQSEIFERLSKPRHEKSNNDIIELIRAAVN